MHECMYVCMHECMYVRTYVCMYVCTYVFQEVQLTWHHIVEDSLL
jgi:hypothetical protein